jgi:hypothetical protein
MMRSKVNSCVPAVDPSTAFLLLLIGLLGSGVAAAADLGDLGIPASRLAGWKSICAPGDSGCAVDLPDTSSWATVDATDASAVSTATQGACSQAADKSDGADDGVAIRCMTDKLPAQTILEFPPGVYDFSSNSGELWVSRSEIVLRGTSGTVFRNHFSGNGGYGSGGKSPLCRPEPHALVCGGEFYGAANPGQISDYATTAWNSGPFTYGTQTINVADAGALALGPGDWIMLQGDVPSNLDVGSENSIREVHRVASVVGNAVGLERGLNDDWDLSGNRVVAKSASRASSSSPSTRAARTAIGRSSRWSPRSSRGSRGIPSGSPTATSSRSATTEREGRRRPASWSPRTGSSTW